VELPNIVKQRLIVDYSISPCPICNKIPVPYNNDIDGPQTWYVHCRDEDSHRDNMDNGWEDGKIEGAYGESSEQLAIQIWNNFVYGWKYK